MRAGVAFGDVGGYRGGGAADLASQPKHFTLWERLGDLVADFRPRHRLLPDDQLSIMCATHIWPLAPDASHLTSSLAPRTSHLAPLPPILLRCTPIKKAGLLGVWSKQAGGSLH